VSDIYRTMARKILAPLVSMENPESYMVGVLKGMDAVADGALSEWWKWREECKSIEDES